MLILLSLVLAPFVAHANTPEEVNAIHRELKTVVASAPSAHSREFFDPADLEQVAKAGAGLPIEAAFDAVQKELLSRYGSAINTRRRWIFNDAGAALGELTMLYCSAKEYLIFFGSPIGTSGFSGRYPGVEFWDIMMAGEMRTYSEGELQASVFKAGQTAHLLRGQAKGYSITPGSWMLEYGRGDVLSAFGFGVLGPARYITRDWKSAFEQFKECGKLAVKDPLRSL